MPRKHVRAILSKMYWWFYALSARSTSANGGSRCTDILLVHKLEHNGPRSAFARHCHAVHLRSSALACTDNLYSTATRLCKRLSTRCPVHKIAACVQLRSGAARRNVALVQMVSVGIAGFVFRLFRNRGRCEHMLFVDIAYVIRQYGRTTVPCISCVIRGPVVTRTPHLTINNHGRV